MAELYRTTRIVEFRDTDMAGIMHFASFFGYMESAEHEFIRTLGFSIHAKNPATHSERAQGTNESAKEPLVFSEESISFPRVHASCDYLTPALCEQLLEISVGVKRIGEKSLTYEFQFHHEEQHIAKGYITCVCCLIRANRPPVSRKLPAGLIEKLKQYQL